MYVYILLLDEKFYYTGMTNNLERRFKEHLTRKKGYTSRFKTKRIIAFTITKDRITARKLEIKIKKQGAKKFLVKNRKYFKFI